MLIEALGKHDAATEWGSLVVIGHVSGQTMLFSEDQYSQMHDQNQN
jgi:hypothetical protein